MDKQSSRYKERKGGPPNIVDHCNHQLKLWIVHHVSLFDSGWGGWGPHIFHHCQCFLVLLIRKNLEALGRLSVLLQELDVPVP